MLKKYKTQNVPSIEMKVEFDPETKTCNKMFNVVFPKYASAIFDD